MKARAPDCKRKILKLCSRSRCVSSSDDPNGEQAGTDEEDEEAIRRPHYDFSKLSPRIQQVIDDYGAVFPKLNWSSPQVRLSIYNLLGVYATIDTND